ncbi:hypothetical protein Tco_1438027 [Tanacetum coccineum]
MIDYSLWEVIENGNAPPITKVIEGVETTIAPTTAEEKAVEKRFKGNVATKKTQRNLLKHHQLEIHGESISQEDVNQKFLRSLSPKWNTHAIVWRNKSEIDTLSLDDLYNNLKICEPEVKGTSSSSKNIQNVTFVSLNNTSSINGAVNTAHGATTASTQATAVNLTTIDNLSDAGSKEPRKQEKEITRRVMPVETTMSNALVSCDGSGYDWIDQAEEGPTNFALMAYSSTSSNSEVSTDSNCLESIEARLLVYNKNESVYKEDIKVLKREIHLREVAITELKRKLELAQKQKDEIQLTVENFENSSKNLSKLIDCQIVDKCKTGLRYNVVPPPYRGNFMPLKPDLSFSGLEEFTSEPIVIKPVAENSEAKASEAKPKVVRKNISAPIIEDWVSDNEEDDVPQAKIEKKTFKPSFARIEFVKPKQQEKTAKKTVNHVKQNRKTFIFLEAIKETRII